MRAKQVGVVTHCASARDRPTRAARNCGGRTISEFPLVDQISDATIALGGQDLGVSIENPHVVQVQTIPDWLLISDVSLGRAPIISPTSPLTKRHPEGATAS